MLFTAVSSVRSHHRHKAVNWRRPAAAASRAWSWARWPARRSPGCLDARLLTIVFTALVYYAATLMLIERKPRPRQAAARQRRHVGHGRHRRALLQPHRDRRRGDGRGLSRAPQYAGARSDRDRVRGGSVPRVRGHDRLRGHRVPRQPGCRSKAWASSICPRSRGSWSASMLIAPVGAAVAHRTPGRTLRRVFAVVLFALATSMLLRFF